MCLTTFGGFEDKIFYEEDINEMKRKVLACVLIVIMLTSLQGCGLIKDTKESNGEGKTKVESALTAEKETKKDSKSDENIVQEKRTLWM